MCMYLFPLFSRVLGKLEDLPQVNRGFPFLKGPSHPDEAHVILCPPLGPSGHWFTEPYKSFQSFLMLNSFIALSVIAYDYKTKLSITHLNFISQIHTCLKIFIWQTHHRM